MGFERKWRRDGHCVVDDFGVIVADCSDEDFGKTEKQAEADAKFIAAAAAVHEQSKALAKTLKEFYPKVAQSLELFRLEQALARAEGEE